MALSEEQVRALLEPSLTSNEPLSDAACALTRVPVATLLALVLGLPLAGVAAAVLSIQVGHHGALPAWGVGAMVGLALALMVVGVLLARRRSRTYLVGLTATRLVVAELARAQPPAALRRWDYTLVALARVPITSRELNVAPASAKPVYWLRLELMDAARPLRVDFVPSLMPGNVAHGNAITRVLVAAGSTPSALT